MSIPAMIHEKPSTQNPEGANEIYYQQFCKITAANEMFLNELKQLIEQKKQLRSKFQKLEKKYDQMMRIEEQASGVKKKRVRRTAKEIQRKYFCPAEYCQKSYGVEGALNQHIKLKHPECHRDREEGQIIGEEGLQE